MRADGLAGRLDPVEHRHADVHQHDIGSQPCCGSDSIIAVDRFADDDHVGLVFEDLAQPDADEGLIVGDQDGRHRIGSTTLTAKPPVGLWLASKRPP